MFEAPQRGQVMKRAALCGVVTGVAILIRAATVLFVPITALNYVLVAVMGHFFFGERILPIQAIGLGAILLGVALVALPAPSAGHVPEPVPPVGLPPEHVEGAEGAEGAPPAPAPG